MKRPPLGNYGLAWVLLALFLVSWFIQTWTGWREFEAEQREHQQSAVVFGADGYVWNWAEATFENWQSEFLQLFTMVVLTAYLIYKGSSESKDSTEEMQAALDRIERRLSELNAAPSDGRHADAAHIPSTGD